MCHRIRAGLANEDFRQLMGIVEVDDAYIGGDDGNRHLKNKKGKGGKSIIIGAVERKGNVVARVSTRPISTPLRISCAACVATK
jgi:hypothetical protein